MQYLREQPFTYHPKQLQQQQLLQQLQQHQPLGIAPGVGQHMGLQRGRSDGLDLPPPAAVPAAGQRDVARATVVLRRPAVLPNNEELQQLMQLEQLVSGQSAQPELTQDLMELNSGQLPAMNLLLRHQ